MDINAPWDDSIEIIVLKPVKKLLGINPMGIIAPRDDSLEIISLQKLNNIAGD